MTDTEPRKVSDDVIRARRLQLLIQDANVGGGMVTGIFDGIVITAYPGSRLGDLETIYQLKHEIRRLKAGYND